ncbi:unnamed protein product [Vicia faba]|uniref:Uncharacterized protein n=1 Tax=Vicia faba TaxID=3906 RepID=A0AAV1A873_VICFA|nr:unnamed protein product [Vicia faba]
MINKEKFQEVSRNFLFNFMMRAQVKNQNKGWFPNHVHKHFTRPHTLFQYNKISKFNHGPVFLLQISKLSLVHKRKSKKRVIESSVYHHSITVQQVCKDHGSVKTECKQKFHVQPNKHVFIS